MPGATVVQQVRLDQLEAEVRALGVDPGAIDFSRGLGNVSIYLSGQARLNFSGEHEPDGLPWPPFKRTPSARRGGPSAKLLWDRGFLAASMSARAADGAIRDVRRAFLEHGSNLEYAAFQFRGTATIPARNAVGVTAAGLAKIETIIADDVVRQLGYGAPSGAAPA